MHPAVVDTYALMTIQELCVGEANRNQVFRDLTQAVMAGELTFPDAVLRECRDFAPDEVCTVWVEAVSGHRALRAVPDRWLSEALHGCQGLVDQNGPDIQSGPDVAAMALCLEADAPPHVTIVTDDLETPTERTPLAIGSAALGLEQMTMRDYLWSRGLGSLIA